MNHQFMLITNKHSTPKRMIIYPKDVKVIIGKSYRTACDLLHDVRKTLNKEEHQAITISEFCAYMGLEEQLVVEFLL
jgi:hypothetical protein